MGLLDELLSQIDSLDEKDRKELETTVLDATKEQKWFPNPGPQTDAYFSDAFLTLYGGAGGGGKGLLPDEVVMTPYGYRKMKSLKVGDRVLAQDGAMSQIIGVYPQHKQQVYRVKFQDGAEIITDGPHKWNYSVSGKPTWRKSGRKWKVGTTELLREMISDGRTILIPVCEPLKINKTYKFDQRKIDPYVLGLLLGDGYIAQAGVAKSARITLSSIDEEIVESLPGEWGVTGICYYAKGEYRKLLDVELAKLGLSGCKSDTKFIPEPYKLGSVEQRWALLQGLMDTDGTASEDGKAYYTSVSKQLAEDVRWLVFSLGGRASIFEKETGYRNADGQKVPCKTSYNVYIRMQDNRDLFRLERKRRRCGLQNGGAGELKRKIVSIEPCGEAKTICIAIDHPTSLYVAGKDLIVTHNSDCGLGLAFTEHRRSLLMRRKYVELSGLTDRAIDINGTRKGYNGSAPPKLVTTDNRLIEFGAAEQVGSEQSWQGRAHDLLYIDEAAQFAESQIRFLMGWVRSTEEGQRCRVVLGSNPPLSDEGMWMISMFAPWLDENHPNPAKPGELRWYLTDAGQDVEVPGPGAYWFNGVDYVLTERDEAEDGVLVALSRTFIPAKLKDNPYLMRDAQYKAQQDALPEHLRNAVRDGKFTAARSDHELQLIPSEWIQAAMDRWKAQPHNKAPQCAIGVDPVRGGNDSLVIAPRYDGWYAPLVKMEGKKAKDGPTIAAEVLKVRTDQSVVIIDMGGGYGGSPYDCLITNINDDYIKQHKGSEATHERTLQGNQTFYNKRAWVYYRFKEALDPNQPGGSPIALPPDPKLFAMLCAIRLKQDDLDVIQLETKKDLVKRIGCSPDEADAVVMAWSAGPKQDNFRGGWDGHVSGQATQKNVKTRSRSASRFDNKRKRG